MTRPFLFILLALLEVSLPSVEAYGWVSAALEGDEHPPTLCVYRAGLSSFYVHERVEIQQRHGSWTLYWSAARPTGFTSEEQVALLTEEELAQLLLGLAGRLTAPPLNARVQALETSPSCPPASPSEGWGVQTTLSLYIAPHERVPLTLLRGLSSEQQAKRAARGLWLQWSLGDVEAQLDPSAELAYELIERLLSTHVSRPFPTDQLLTPQERGHLLVKTSRPARLAIDGVSYGRPTQKPIPTSPGLHTLTLYPFTPPFGPFTYRQVEVERGKLTRLTLSLE